MADARPVRRLLTIDDARGKSRAIEDAPVRDVRTDAAGVSSTLVWATDRSPASITTRLPRIGDDLTPPRGGSLCRIVTFPPGDAPARKTRTLDFCLVLEGEITLVLDAQEVALSAGDVVVQRGTRHAWSNRSPRACVLAISSHDAEGEANA
jgi:quercetin dioxygenase-like cupin family protein